MIIRFQILTIFMVCFSSCTVEYEPFIDNELNKVIRANEVKPLKTKPFYETKKYILGRALFYDPILSGNRDVSCATCHLAAFGSSDGLARSIGVGGRGVGAARKATLLFEGHKTNSLDLWNRDHNSVTAFFWDGRIHPLGKGRFFSPLEGSLPEGMDNAMAVQALFPLITADEMMGYQGQRSSPDLPKQHRNRENDFAIPDSSSFADLAEHVYPKLTARLLGDVKSAVSNFHWQEIYRKLFLDAYPKTLLKDMSIVQIGNALSHFQETAFATRNTPWDKYVSGNIDAITQEQKYGALLFFGKGRCSVCHVPPLFSDFEFHSLAVNGMTLEQRNRRPDKGRYMVTAQDNDLYEFRTPPLRNVTLTAPYFHDGSGRSLEEVILHHIDPLKFADAYLESGRFAMTPDEIDSVSPLLVDMPDLSGLEIRRLIDFLRSLEDFPQDFIARVVPAEVPSGLPISSVQ